MSSQSGVSVNPECITKFNELKLGKSFKWIIYKIVNSKEIIVEDTGKDADWDTFRKKLIDAKEPRYAVYDLEYDAPGDAGKRSKITFVAWSPDDAPVRPKMTYASSKDAIRRALNGVAAEVQATDSEEIEYDVVVGKVSSGKR